ncbi:hypothetical protein OMP43_21615 [Sphingomonas sp. CBMAI 2297]|uniref:hypothetical protein n=1 Tax=Sphingomonas sp. CBMAI 2297 TaxID=2991720 RepID=UPI00245455EF|nr:hypothetical protein [Sphingomonas sp. CBMAI 2297]MDH4746629.1 hypothetical protein [Sphingomonas sp. CBMAI 2297]
MLDPRPASSPRRLVRFWHVVRDGLPVIGRYRRYAVSAAIPFLMIWIGTIAYLATAPVRYTSRATLILPGSGVGGSMNLDTIGQASTVTSSAFSSPSLSPTENYKRLLMADITRRNAASMLGEAPDRFPVPIVKLTDQTNLIETSMAGATPSQAQRRMEAIRQAFLLSLDRLRTDEARKREAADRAQIANLQEKAREAQQHLLEFQGRTGLVSLDQFNNRVAALDTLRDREHQAQTMYRQSDVAQRRIAASLGVSMITARDAMLLRQDPEFQSILARLSALDTQLNEKSATLGDRHMTIEELKAQTLSLHQALAARGRQLTGMSEPAMARFADLSVSDARAQLLGAAVTGDSQAAGARAAVAEIRSQIGDQASGVPQLAAEASQLADLTRDLRVADAVFSSALARLDTNKADPFASYPLVQTLEAPSLPTGRSSPSLMLALCGAVGASLLLLVGLVLAWLRQPIIRALLPNA